MLGIVPFPEFLSIKLQSRTVTAALQDRMKMWAWMEVPRAFQRPSLDPHRDTGPWGIESELWTASRSKTLDVRR